MAVGRLLGRVVLAAILTLHVSPAAAWEPETRVRMVDEAVRLMPASLRKALESHRQYLLRGMLAPMVAEDGAPHQPPWVQRVIRWTSAALKLCKWACGAYVYCLSDAFIDTGGFDERYYQFSLFCEDRRERFPLVFYGHADDALAGGDWRRFALRELERSKRDDVELARAYAAAGNPPNPAAFSDRSVPFAVGSLAYSRSITNIVRVWLNIWQRANGDMGRTPYWQPSDSPGG